MAKLQLCVTLDLSKCFDVVPHSTLLEKLCAFGVDIEWFHSYLPGHTQQVRLGGAATRHATPVSGAHTAVSGLPQHQACPTRRKSPQVFFRGGALSCILYALFSNDLSSHIGDEVTTVCYADDTTPLTSVRKSDLNLVISRMEAALQSAYQWFCHNRLKVNAKKTQMVVIGIAAMLRNLPPISLNSCGTRIVDSRVVKSLCVTIDRHLNYQAHIDSITRKCTGILVALSHARHVIPRRVLKVIVESLAVSVVRYCLSVYDSCGATQGHRIQKILNFCARVVTGRRKFDHIADTFDQLGWLNAQLISLHAVCAVGKAVASGVPESIAQTIGPPANQVHGHCTRNSNHRALPRIRTEAGRRRLCYRGVDILKGIGIEPTTASFKADAKTCLLLESGGSE